MIIGLCGQKNSGKNSVADIICKLVPTARQVAFAAKLKLATEKLLGLSEQELERYKRYEDDVELHILGKGSHSEQVFKPLGVSVRGFLQRLGTEVGREMFGHNFWLEQTLPRGKYHKDQLIVVTDLRFDNEASWIKGVFGGIIWNVERPGILREDYHISEERVNPLLYNETIINDGSLTDLNYKVKILLRKHNLLS